MFYQTALSAGITYANAKANLDWKLLTILTVQGNHNRNRIFGRLKVMENLSNFYVQQACFKKTACRIFHSVEICRGKWPLSVSPSIPWPEAYIFIDVQNLVWLTILSEPPFPTPTILCRHCLTAFQGVILLN